jgi:hypothetical protein
MHKNEKEISCSEREFNYAWKWYKFHAKQRSNSIYFYLTMTPIIFYALYNESITIPKLLVSLTGLFTSVLFLFLDVKNRNLVEAGKNALKNTLEEEKCNIIIEAESKNNAINHKWLVRSIMILSTIIFAYYSITNLCNCSTFFHLYKYITI